MQETNALYTEDTYKTAVEYFQGDTLSAQQWLMQYAARNDNGEVADHSPHDMVGRMVYKLLEIEQQYSHALTFDELLSLLDRFHYIVPSEGLMLGTGNGVLGIRLDSYVDQAFTPKAQINTELFAKHIQKAQRIADDMVEIELKALKGLIACAQNSKDASSNNEQSTVGLEQLLQQREQCRSTSIQIVNVDEALLALGIANDMAQVEQCLTQVYKCLLYNSYQASVELSNERGAFPLFDANIEEHHPWVNLLYTDENKEQQALLKHGRRNMCCVSARTVGDAEQWVKRAAQHQIKNEQQLNLLVYPLDKAYHRHFIEQYVAQQWSDEERISTLYGAKNANIEDTDSEERAANQASNKPFTIMETRPKELECDVVRFQNNKEKWVAFVGLVNGRPYEIFTGLQDDDEGIVLPKSVTKGKIIKHKQGDAPSRYDFQFENKRGYKTTVEGLSEKFNPEYWNYAKLISGVLRYGMPIARVINLVSSLQLKDKSINTWTTGVERALKKYVDDGTVAVGECCPVCGCKTMIYQNGNLVCKNCGANR